MWTIEDFEEEEVGERNSLRLSHLTRLCAFIEEDLCKLAEDLEKADQPSVVVFFQLPQPIFTEDEVYRIGALESGICVDFRFKPICLSLNEKAMLTLNPLPAPSSRAQMANGTQVAAVIGLWGKRADHFEKYESCFAPAGFRNRVIVNAEDYWGKPRRALTAVDFELNLVERIDREIRHSLKKFLKAYAVKARSPLIPASTLFNFFCHAIPRQTNLSGSTSATCKPPSEQGASSKRGSGRRRKHTKQHQFCASALVSF